MENENEETAPDPKSAPKPIPLSIRRLIEAGGVESFVRTTMYTTIGRMVKEASLRKVAP